MLKRIYLMYEEYKRYMNEKNLPDIQIFIEDDTEAVVSSFAYIEDFSTDVVAVHVSPKLFEYNDQFIRSILYHEFTHIYDGYILFTEYKRDDRFLTIMATYSEFHASQIEISCALGVNRFDAVTARIPLSSKLYYQNEYIDINDYLLRPLAEAITPLTRPQSYYESFSNAQLNYILNRTRAYIMYYLGKYSACRRITTSHPHDFFDKFGEFKTDVMLWLTALELKDIDTIVRMYSLFASHFIKYIGR